MIYAVLLVKFFNVFKLALLTTSSIWCFQAELESFKDEYANVRLECNAADERAKILASEVIGLEEKVIICFYFHLLSILLFVQQDQNFSLCSFIIYI